LGKYCVHHKSGRLRRPFRLSSADKETRPGCIRMTPGE
jgi:hypothetical protein